MYKTILPHKRVFDSVIDAMSAEVVVVICCLYFSFLINSKKIFIFLFYNAKIIKLFKKVKNIFEFYFLSNHCVQLLHSLF